MTTAPPGPAAGGFPRVILPRPAQLFEARAACCRDLSVSRPALSGYLTFLARLAARQSALVENLVMTPVIRAQAQSLSIEPRPRDPGWIAALHALIQDFPADNEPMGEALRRLSSASTAELQTWADAWLAGAGDTRTAGMWPFMAAALQATWTTAAARLEAEALARKPAGGTCPACAALPVAGMLKTGGAVQGLRYLHCGLCGTEWHRPRLQCMHCGSSAQLAYYQLEDVEEGVKAEACGDCRSYLKLIDCDRRPASDVCADDLATLALDVLMSEEGYVRLGCNLFLMPDAG